MSCIGYFETTLVYVYTIKCVCLYAACTNIPPLSNVQHLIVCCFHVYCMRWFTILLMLPDYSVSAC